jgi:hypothetical protein
MRPPVLDGSPCRKSHSGVAFVLILSALIVLNSLSQAADEGAPKAIRRSSPQIGVAIKDQKRVALVIGNSAYRIGPLRNPVRDAEDLSGVLRTLGFAVQTKTNVNQREMEEAVNRFVQEIQNGDVALFYFSGHGVQVRGENFLIPVGGSIESESDVRYKAVNAGLVLGKMEESRNRTNIFILDACRNNPFRRFRSLSRGLTVMDAPVGTFIAYATAPGSVAADGTDRNSPYAKALMHAIKEKGVEIHLAFQQVLRDVWKETEGKQVPWIASSVPDKFYFNPPSSPRLQEPSLAPPRPVTVRPEPDGRDQFLVRFYKVPKETRVMPDFSALPGMKTTTSTKINLDFAEVSPEPSSVPSDSPGLGMRFSGRFQVDGEGIFQWRLRFKGSARLHLDDKTLIDGESFEAPSSKSGFVYLAEGPHTIMVDALDVTGEPVLQLWVTPPYGLEETFTVRHGLQGWKEPQKPYDVLWGQVYFFPKGDYSYDPDFGRRNPVGRLIAADLNISGSGGFPGLPVRKDRVGIRYDGFFAVKGAGLFAFRLVADRYAKLTIGKQTIVKVTGEQKGDPHGQIGWAFLQEGTYPISVEYFHLEGEQRLQLFVVEPERPVEKVFSPAQALKGYSNTSKDNMIPAFVYFLNPGTTQMPNFNDLSPAGIFFTKAINYPVARVSHGFPGLPKRDDWFGLRFYVKFSLSDQEAGVYKFRIAGEGLAKLVVAKKVIISADAPSKTLDRSGTIVMRAGSLEMFLDYLHTTGPKGLQLFITPPGGQERIFGFDSSQPQSQQHQNVGSVQPSPEMAGPTRADPEGPQAPDYASAVTRLVRSIEKSDDRARKEMDSLYNNDKAMAWIITAADQGNPDAQFALARRYHLGKGVPKDRSMARRWYLEAAKLGCAGAECNLGYLYYYGQGVAKDRSKAFEWFRRAADHGDADAHRMLANQYNK